jgi:hypothetical protein
MEKIIITGSRAFFSKYNDFKPKDKDVVYIIENDSKVCKYYYRHYTDLCIVNFINFDKETLINIVMSSKVVPMTLCNLLIPEFVEHFNITIDDLKQLKKIRDSLDYKHFYLRIIYDAYLENGKFELTQEQRDRAYASYKSWRPDFYN